MKIILQQFIYIGLYINDKFYIVSIELICLVEENNTYFVPEKPDFWSRHQISSFNVTPRLKYEIKNSIFLDTVKTL